MKYYQLEDDIKFPGRWYLGDINIRDNWLFSKPTSVNAQKYKKLKIGFDRPGKAMDYTTTDLFKVSIISAAMVECLADFMDDIQLIPIAVSGMPVGAFYVLIIKNVIDCLDEERSAFEKFEKGNDIRPDKAGEYMIIYKFKIDTNKVNKHIFRLGKYDHFVIISEHVKKKIGERKLTGIKLKLVS